MVAQEPKLTRMETKLRSFHRIVSFAARFNIDLNEIEYINDALFDGRPCQVFCVWDVEGNDHYLFVFDCFLIHIGHFNNLVKFEKEGMLRFIDEGGEEYENDQIEAH